ncbi:MAG: protein kinase, partial [Bdellovibrionia bacterium]
LLEGLGTLHHAGVHHRDIKPANILISYDDKRLPHAHIADFGEAYDLVNPDENKNLKPFGGTVAYMSPEYIRGSGKPPSNQNLKNDVWAMGLVFYDLEHGKEPDFYSKLGGNTMALMYRIASKLLNYPSLGEIFGIHFDPANPPLQSTYEYVLFRMLDPDVNNRVTSQEALKMMKVVQEHSRQMSPNPMRFRLKIISHLARRYSWAKVEGSSNSPESSGIKKIQLQIETRFKAETEKYHRVLEADKVASTVSSNSESYTNSTGSSSAKSQKSIPGTPRELQPTENPSSRKGSRGNSLAQ